MIESLIKSWEPNQTKDKRRLLLNISSTLAIKEQKYYADRERPRDQLFQALLEVADEYPEFILQVSYYVRNKLDIKSTANFILAFATDYNQCKPFCRKYFNSIIRLPSDLIEVSEYAQLIRYYFKFEWIGFTNGYLRYIPFSQDCRKELNFSKMLQKCGALKFQQFSLYQLSKYCSESRRKKIIYKFQEIVDSTLFRLRYQKRAKKLILQEKIKQKMKKKEQKKINKKITQRIQKQKLKQQKHPRKKTIRKSLDRKFLTMKDLIKYFHISQPKFNVMCILRSKYPENEDQFKQLFPQDNLIFNKKLVGKRLKLPIAQTWERELSQSKDAKVWDKLLKEDKIPYLALIRNLRNIFQNYLSPKAYQKLCQYISNQEIILKNRIQPLQYYKALEQLLQIQNDQRSKQVYKLLNDAMSISLKNISTIPGKTHLFVDCTGSMSYQIGNQTLQIAAFVLSQLIRFKCEYCEFYVFGGEKVNAPYLKVNFTDEDIYESVQKCNLAIKQIGQYHAMIGQTIIDLLVSPKIFCDNIIIISDMQVEKNCRNLNFTFDQIIDSYRQTVNKNIQIFFIDVSSQGYEVSLQQMNCHYICGVSEKIVDYMSNQYVDQTQEVIEFSKNVGQLNVQ